MSYEIQLTDVTPRATAVVRDRVVFAELASSIRGLFDEVYGFLATSSVRQAGHNIILYLDDEPNIEVGVEVSAPFVAEGRVASSSTPAGRAATAVHSGPYSDLPAAHQAIRLWCADHGHALAGPNWEIYGDWEEDPDKLRTDVFYLLR